MRRCHFRPFLLLWLCVGLGLTLVACESSSAAPEPKRAARVHPVFPVPPSPEMIAQSMVGIADRDAGTAPVAPPKNWDASCQVNRSCATKEQAVPTCESGRVAGRWSDAQIIGDSLEGKTIDVKGQVGLTPAQNTGNANKKCAPNSCCHALRMDITIDGEPLALPLVGFSCSGDDSKLCCTVPADGQQVIAHGRLKKSSKSGYKWQLEDATLCVPAPPPVPDH